MLIEHILFCSRNSYLLVIAKNPELPATLSTGFGFRTLCRLVNSRLCRLNSASTMSFCRTYFISCNPPSEGKGNRSPVRGIEEGCNACRDNRNLSQMSHIRSQPSDISGIATGLSRRHPYRYICDTDPLFDTPRCPTITSKRKSSVEISAAMTENDNMDKSQKCM